MRVKREIFIVLIIGIIVWFISTFFYQICFVHGPSMEPTLYNNQMIFIQKFNINLNYGDIVVAKKNNHLLIKRVVGLPGDTIKIDNYLYRNGVKVDDIYMKPVEDFSEISLKENEFFLLGDNRNNSIDSRFKEIGAISRNEIIGKKLF